MTADAFSLVRSAVIDRRYRNSFQVGLRHSSIAQMKQLLLLAICLTISVPAFAQSVSVKDGNIQFTDKSGNTTALTTSGRDSNPLLAPDGKWVAFVRKVDGKKIATGSDEVEPTELWQVRVDGKEPSLLVKTRDSEK